MIDALNISHLNVTLGGKAVLRDINVAVAAGQFVGIIGENGAGKTTLLKALLGMIRPDSGSIESFGHPVGHGSKSFGYVPQRVALDPNLPMRARDFVGLGFDGDRWGFGFPSQAKRDRVDAALASVDATRYADTPVGRLSGGEQQRLFVAQALLGDPKILLLDEPLSNLDLRSASGVVEVIDRARKALGVTVLLVTHDVNPLLPVMDNVMYLASGNAAFGSVESIITTEGLSALYGYPVQVLRIGGRIVVLTGTDTAHGCTEI